MSAASTNLKNRYDLLAVGISDPSEISKNKKRNPPKAPKAEKVSQSAPKKSDQFHQNARKDTSRIPSSVPDTSKGPSKQVGKENLDLQKAAPSQQQNRKNFSTSGQSKAASSNDGKVAVNVDDRVSVNSSRPDRNVREFNDNNRSKPVYVQKKPLVDLDDEPVVFDKSDVRRSRYVDNKYHGKERDQENNQRVRGRLFDRHSGTFTGSTAYNKRDNRGPVSSVVKEAQSAVDNESIDSFKNVKVEDAEHVEEKPRNVPQSVHTITFDEFQRIRDSQKVASMTFDLESREIDSTEQKSPDQDKHDSYQRGREDNRYRGRGGFRSDQPRRNRDDQNRGDRSYNYQRSNRDFSPRDSTKPKQAQSVKIDLIADFPALDI